MVKDLNSGARLTAPPRIDRRGFLKKAGLAVAGSAFGCSLGGSLTGCGFELNIPCLGPALAPSPVAGMTYVRASEIGCALDCDLGNGQNKHTGGRATDDGPRINAAMAAATAQHPMTLIIDGSALISGLFLPAGGHWSIAGLGCGTGFFVKKGTNNDGIHNGPPNAAAISDPGPPAPARGANVSLSNFTVNGNQGNGRSGDSTSGSRQGTKTTFYFGINLMNLDNITIEKVVVVNTPAYHVRLSNVGIVAISGCVMKSYGVNTDGLHFDGPANDIAISNCDFTTNDDAIALNCPEGYSGSISRVAVSNCTFNSWSLMRLYTILGGVNFTIDSVTVSNCSGSFSEGAFLIGLYNISSGNSVASLDISDCHLTAPAVLGVGENFGAITLRNVTFVPNQAYIFWNRTQSNRDCGFLRPPPPTGPITYAGVSLSFNNCIIQRNSDISVAGVILESGSIINNLAFNGFSVQDAGAYRPVPELLNLENGSVGQLVLADIQSANIKAPVAEGQFPNIGSVSGAAVLATAWEFPDAVMANGVPYISENSGMPSIKVGGKVGPYPQA